MKKSLLFLSDSLFMLPACVSPLTIDQVKEQIRRETSTELKDDLSASLKEDVTDELYDYIDDLITRKTNEDF